FTTVIIRVDSATLEGLRRAMLPTHTTPSTAAASDLDVLLRLNEDYIHAVTASDVARFEDLLADDFLCTASDGSFLNRQQFLQHTAEPYTLKTLQARDVQVRLMGDTAIVHARTTFAYPDGSAGTGRYTDVWARRSGRWVAVAAHVTRAS